MLEPLIQKELRNFLDDQIIFKVRHSIWISNLVPVRMNSGEIRLCVSFCNLNRASNKDNYLVPSIEQILQRVSRSKIFSLLDGLSRYNQVLEVKPNLLKTTFMFKWGTFTFNRIPFKLRSVGATFQREMDIYFHGLIGHTVVVYLDDVTMFSKRI